MHTLGRSFDVMLPVKFGQALVRGELLENDKRVVHHLLIGMASVVLGMTYETFQDPDREINQGLGGLVD